MKKVIANRTFRSAETHDLVRAGQEVPGSEEYHQELIRNGLAREVAAKTEAPGQKTAAPAGSAGETKDPAAKSAGSGKSAAKPSGSKKSPAGSGESDAK